MPSLNFVYSTELVTLVLGVLVIYFAIHNECVRTMNFTLLMLATHAMMTKVALEFIVLIAVNYMHFEQYWFVNIFCILYLMFHILTVSAILIYIHRLSGNRYNIARINRLIWTVFALYLLGAVVMLYKGQMYSLVDGRLSLNWLVPYGEFLNIFANVFCYLIVMFNKRGYPKTIYRYIRLFMPAALLIQIGQCHHRGIIFITVVDMIIVTVLFFLYHNEVYNDKTGARNTDAFEAHMFKLFKKNAKFDVIILQAEVNPEKLINDVTGLFDDTLRTYCRHIEYLGRKVFLYKLTEDQYAIICSDQNDAERARILAKAKDMLEVASKECNEFASFCAYIYHQADTLKCVEDLKSFAGYLLITKGEMESGTWNTAPDEEYEKYASYQLVEKELLDIARTKNMRDERVLCYAQPIFNVRDGKFHSAEALMRLQINGQLVSPAIFIPIAERLHCLHTLTLIMLNKICTFIEETGKNYEFAAITINSSPEEFTTSSYASDVLEVIVSHNVDPHKIRIELTEDSEIGVDPTIRMNLKNLYDAGIRFYLDDFGTGYSNLCKLFNLRIHTIKFDKSMLYESQKDPDVKASLTAVAKSFQSKGSQILVEGVETDEQEKVALDMGFELIQGFKYAKPVPIEQLVDYFEAK